MATADQFLGFPGLVPPTNPLSNAVTAAANAPANIAPIPGVTAPPLPTARAPGITALPTAAAQATPSSFVPPTPAMGLASAAAAPAAPIPPVTSNTPALTARAAAPTTDIRPTLQPAAAPGMAAAGNFSSGGSSGAPSPLAEAYQRQQDYAQNFIDQAINYINQGGDIFSQATRGRAIAGILRAVAGNNNEGAAQAGVQQANIGAGAQMFGAQLGADTSLTNAALGAQTQQSIAGENNANRLALGYLDTGTRTVPTGAMTTIDANNLPVTLQTYGNFGGPRGANGLPTLQQVTPTRQPTIMPNSVRTNSNGAVQRWDGSQWVNQ